MNENRSEDEVRRAQDLLENKPPQAVFGLLTDIQYADMDNGLNYDKTKTRFYRGGLNLVREAVADWSRYENDTGHKIKFVIQLGDLIDGKCLKSPTDSITSMHRVLDELKRFNVFHIWGNHEFYNFKRKDLISLPLNTGRWLEQNVKANYYYYDVTDRLRLICLDYYEFSALGFDEDDEIYQQAIALLKQHNHNEDLNSAEGLRGAAQRYSKFNGSTSPEQLDWLEKQLSHCQQNGLNVIISGHLPLHQQASDPRCLAWNFRQVLDLIWKYQANVIAYFCGHDHDGGYFRDKFNIHHITFPAIVETPPNSNAYAFVKVFENRVCVEGVGAIGYYDIYFKQPDNPKS